MGGLPKGNDAKDCLDVLQREFGWTYKPTKSGSSHPAGILMCGQGDRSGCWRSVPSTGNNTARKTWAFARRCTHGYAPDRNHW